MRYLLVKEEEISGQMDTTYRPRVPDGRVILAENEAKGLDNFNAQFLSAEALKELMAQQPVVPPSEVTVPDTVPAEELTPSEETEPVEEIPAEEVTEPETVPAEEVTEQEDNELTE